MKLRDYKGQRGVVLVLVLMTLTLFSLIGLTLFCTPPTRRCVNDPNAVVSGDGCTRTIGNTNDTRP